MTDAVPATAEAPPQAPAAAPRAEPFRFSGTAGEYFGIWIVNLFLTIITLGIYSAWAKVRKKRYLYGNTWLADSNFEYHGNPVAILKGRIIAFAAFVAYTMTTQFSPRLAALLLLLVMPAAPWLIVRSFAFNAVNSSYRNLRFHFDGRYREALRAIWPLFLVPLVGILIPDADPKSAGQASDAWYLAIAPALLGILYPYVIAKVRLLHVNRMRFGTAPFHCRATVGDFYVIYVIAGLLFVAMIAVLGFLMGVIVVVTLGFGAFLIPLAYVLFGAVMIAYTRSRLGNLVFNKTTLGDSGHFGSRLRMRKLAAIYATNLLAIILTVGLAIPWAVIRTARYRADCLAFASDQDLDAFTGDIARQVAATGEEMGEMFDVDLSL